MNKLSIRPSAPAQRSENLEISVPARQLDLDTEGFRHLIILIPANAECAAVTRRICKLANETNSCVQLLGLYKDEGEELSLRRELAMASALIRDAKVYVEVTVERGANWVEALRHTYRAGDMIVCIADQSTGFRRKPLSQILESNFKTTIYILSETPMQKQKSRLISQVIAWAGLIAIVGGFFMLQVDITRLPGDGFQTLLLILLLVPEIWLVQFWNSLFF
jgi:hypothetical protein